MKNHPRTGALSLTSDPILYLTWRIALPASVGMLFNTLFNVTDTYCAGLLGTEALAALSLSFPLFFLLIAVGSGLGQGSTALLAHELGAGNPPAARRIFAQSLLVAFAAGGLLTVVGLLSAPWIFQLLGAHDTYLDTTLSYMNGILAGSVFFILTMAFNSALSAQGDTRSYRNFLITGFLANAALNPVFMWGLFGFPALGARGIALATVIVQMAGCAYLWTRVVHTEVFSNMTLGLFQPRADTLRQIAAQSIPAALNMMTIALGVFVITWFVKQFGREAVAATGIATRIEQLILMPVIGISTAMLSITAQNRGAGLPRRVREAWNLHILLGVVLMTGGGLLLGFYGRTVMRLFTDDAIVVAHGADYLWAAAFTLAAYPILFVTVFMMQGLKRPGYGLWLGLCRQVIGPIVIMNLLVFTLGWGLNGVWWGFCFVTWSAALSALFWGWRTVRLLTDPPQRSD
ncbi:MAG: MATE family efflux transporter [Candidatus Methylacidiphilales bacterium]|nr:MATE family efflux transporter [Candidatus Methylacidiphilales bacterium]